ncbi:MAG: ATP-dependent Clp protease proteolytic subunit [Clostridia bacterium]|nr:ATP-dependent Clp protease proteolytic subunit [Clostridia bacterium]
MNEPVFNAAEGRAETLNARLLKKRTVLAFGEIDEKVSCSIVSSLLYLASEDAEAPVTLYINSSGGCETEILAIFDVMRSISCPVETVCVGKAHGLSALLLAGGEKGKRKAYANAEIMLMQVGRDRTFGQASDIELETEHLLKAKNRINKLIASLCGRSEEQIRADLERKHWLYAEEAKEYGLIDQIIG